MNTEINERLTALLEAFNAMLDALHDKFLRELDRQARSVGQRTRVDRL